MAGKITNIGKTQEINHQPPKTSDIKPKNSPNHPPISAFNGQKEKLINGSLMQMKLNAQFDSGKAQHLRNFPPDVRQNGLDEEKVNNAVQRIRDLLTEGLHRPDISHYELSEIQYTLRTLTKEEATEVLSRLSDNELKTWADELDGLHGGYNGAEKKQLFNELAQKLDAQQLSRMMTALGDNENIQSLIESVAQNASPETKADLINLLKDSVETDPQKALLVAKLIGGMGDSPEALEGVLQNLNQNQLQAIVRAASQESLVSYNSGNFNPDGGMSLPLGFSDFNPQPLVNMLNAVSQISNPILKANVFHAGALELDRIENYSLGSTPRQQEITQMIRGGLTGLLLSDTNGVMQSLEANFRNGNGITAYLKSMIKGGEHTQIRGIIEQLTKGNDLNGDHLTRFSEQVPGTDNRLFYQNAQVLGYFAGALIAATGQITADRSQQANIFKNIFGTIAGAIGATGTDAGIGSAVINGLTSAGVDEIINAMNNGTIGAVEGLQQLLFPTSPDGRSYNGDAEADYDSAVERVITHNS